MKARISSFRRGRHVQTMNQMVLISSDVSNKEDASKLVGKEVVFLTAKGNAINGKVTSAHGNKGAIRALFEKGMPGQSLGKEVEIK
jgi:large subunit ribosomal protein L35Ae